MNTWLSKVSIRYILPVVIVAPVFAVALVLIVLAYRTGQRSANELAGQNIRQIHQRIENHLNHLMDLPPAINELNLSSLRTAVLDLDNPGRDLMPVFETLRAFPQVSSVVIGSARGQVMWVIRYPGETSYEYGIKDRPDGMLQEYSMGPQGQIGSSALRSYAFDPVQRPWYRAAIDAGGPTWGSVYVWVRGGKGVTLGVPFVEPYRDANGNVLGVINCELTLADISAFLKQLQVGKTGLAFIVERDGNLVANSIGLDCMKDGTARLAAAEAPDARIAAAAASLKSRDGSLGSINGIQLEHTVIGGQPTQLVVSSFRNRRNLDWLIVTLVPDGDFLADVQHARNRSTLVGLGAVAATLLLGVGLAVWLLKPILAVVAHARRVGAGDLDARLVRHDNREIWQLSRALNEMADGLKDRVRLRHALNLAMEVQQSLLPSETPRIDGLDVAARSKYCDETGGDYYDYLEVEGLGPASMVIALGDVTGHGIAAAMLMATARGVLRSQVRTEGSLGKLLTHVNEHLVADTGGTKFMTMFLGVIDAQAMVLRWASAGHDQPMIYDPQKGFLSEIDEHGGGLPLGVEESEQYQEHTYSELRPGQVMLIGTDGLWEARNTAGEEFGKQRVGDALAELSKLSAAEIESGIYKKLKEFCTGRAIADDVTYIVIKFADPKASATAGLAI